MRTCVSLATRMSDLLYEGNSLSYTFIIATYVILSSSGKQTTLKLAYQVIVLICIAMTVLLLLACLYAVDISLYAVHVVLYVVYIYLYVVDVALCVVLVPLYAVLSL